jgi:hypothetical protein
MAHKYHPIPTLALPLKGRESLINCEAPLR